MSQAWAWVCLKAWNLRDRIGNQRAAYLWAVLLSFGGSFLLPRIQISEDLHIVLSIAAIALTPIISFATIETLMEEWLESRTNQKSKGAALLVTGVLILVLVGGSWLWLRPIQGEARIALHYSVVVLMGVLTTLSVTLVKALLK